MHNAVICYYGSKIHCRQGQATEEIGLTLPHKIFAVLKYFGNVNINTNTKLTAFLSLSNQHLTLSHIHNMWPKTAEDLNSEELMKRQCASYWATLLEGGNLYRH